ncbi:MAG: ABC transporter permease [Candidatus Cardinium sp.]|nr:ABC transporter permease [Candidatus Cardinium sp.]
MTWLHAFKEAYQSVRTHKTRTLSMGFGVSLAIFMLQLSLAVGHSLHKGVSQAFAKYGEKSMWIYVYGKGIPIPTELVASLAKQFKAIRHISSTEWHWSPNEKVTYSNKTISSPFFLATDPIFATQYSMELQEGRFITTRDIATIADTCVVGATIKKALFGETAAVGKSIIWGSKCLKVVGVIEDTLHLSWLSNRILLGNSLYKSLYPENPRYSTIRLTLMPTAHSAVAEKQFRFYLARQLNVDPNDTKAIRIFSLEKHAARFHRFFKNLSIASWIMGILLLVTGIVNLSNMMLVTIQERTKEIAIRRVLGSSVTAIIALIAWEVLLVTMVAGVLGGLSNFALMQLLNKWVIPLCIHKGYFLFTTLTCSFEMMLSCLGLLYLTSTLTSIAPIIRAIRIKPATALNS